MMYILTFIASPGFWYSKGLWAPPSLANYVILHQLFFKWIFALTLWHFCAIRSTQNIYEMDLYIIKYVQVIASWYVYSGMAKVHAWTHLIRSLSYASDDHWQGTVMVWRWQVGPLISVSGAEHQVMNYKLMSDCKWWSAVTISQLF